MAMILDREPPLTARARGLLLAPALDRAAGSRAIPGNAVRHFAESPDALSAMRAIIVSAQRYVHFENYIIRNDATGRSFADLLVAAAGRGVRARVLYDPVGSFGTPARFWRSLTRAGVEVRQFNPFRLLRPDLVLTRDHRKYVCADGNAAIVGGVCIGDEWAGDPGRERRPWRDTAVEICGPAVSMLERTFARLWNASGSPLDEAHHEARVQPCGDAVVRVVEGAPGHFRAFRTVELLATAAVERLWIAEAYLLPPQAMYASLLAAARDGVDVRLLLPGRSDVPVVTAMSRVGYRELLEAGVRIWEWGGPMLHSKTVLGDGIWFKVGSSNLNASSLRYNHELDVLIEDVGITRKAAVQFRLDLAQSVEIVRRRPQRVLGLLSGGVTPAAPARPAGRRESGVERSRRAVATLQQVAVGATRSLGGAVVFGLTGAAVLLVAVPRVMSYLMAAACLWLAGSAALRYVERRRQAED